MKITILFLLFITVTANTTIGGDNPYNYFNLRIGTGNYKKPLIYNYGLEYSRDIKLTNKSYFLTGLSWDNYRQKKNYPVDTNFVFESNSTGSTATIRYYYRVKNSMAVNLSIGYKYWLRYSKAYSLFIEGRLITVFDVRTSVKYEYYYRDTNQVLHMGPAMYNYVEKNYSPFVPDNLKGSLSFGYLKNFRKNLAYYLKLDLNLAIPDQEPGELSLIYPVIGLGLALR